MKIKKTDVERISIWSRGKNRDFYGNPYYAYVCRISLTQKARGEREITPLPDVVGQQWRV